MLINIHSFYACDFDCFPQITGEMARDAAALAGIDAAIRALPEGYDTVCTEGIFSPVSYTHLDVYKRQACYGTSAAGDMFFYWSLR